MFTSAFSVLDPVSEIPCQSYDCQTVVIRIRSGGSKPNIAQKLVAFFLGKSPPVRPQPTCPKSDLGPRFRPGSGSSPWGDSGPDPCQQRTPPRSQWRSDNEYYRYDHNQNRNTNRNNEEENQDQPPVHGQCQARELVSRINEDEGLIRAAEEACKNEAV